MHDTSQDAEVPVSSGFPTIVRVAAAIGLGVIFIMGGLVVSNSAGNHVWPASDSVNVPLSTTLTP